MDEENQERLYSYDAMGNVIASRDRLGNWTTATFGALGRISKLTDPSGETTSWITSILPEGGFTSTRTDQAGFDWVAQYDAASRMISSTDPEGFSETYTYDPLGRQIAKSDQAGNTWQATYSLLGRVRNTDPDGKESFFSYRPTGEILSAVDSTGFTESWNYNYIEDLGDDFRRIDTLVNEKIIHSTIYDLDQLPYREVKPSGTT